MKLQTTRGSEEQTMTVHVSRADVVTDAPARYAKQLVAHLGRRVPFTTEGNTSTAVLEGTTAAIIVGDNVLTMTATGADPTTVARLEQALGSHLERFGQRRELTVSWTRTVDGETPLS
jgi:hypothetical protein